MTQTHTEHNQFRSVNPQELQLHVVTLQYIGHANLANLLIYFQYIF
jgi:hypothetical protein